MLKNVQTLRFFAAIWVVLHHIAPPITPFRFALIPDSVSQLGFAGVDVFFVISGLIMAQTTRGLPPGPRAAGQFLLQRFGRIYIGWWPFFLLYFIAIKKLNTIPPQVNLAGSFFLWPQDLTQYLLPITWTLSFELYFYLIVSMIILFGRQHAVKVLGLLGVLIIALNAIFHFKGMYLPQNEALAKRYLVIPFYASPLIIEFIGGFLLCEYLHRKENPVLLPWMLGSLTSIWLASWYQFQAHLNASGMAGFFHVIERSVLFGTFAICISACGLILEKRNITPFKLLQRLGDASYSIYLSHIFFIAAAGTTYVLTQNKWGFKGSVWWLLTISIILIYSWINFAYIEKPLHYLLKRLIKRLL
ncbi:acyltransferase [Diaphorobacter sp. HDW4A]|uniref:acyltransferase family protein n=1 Tax=Diaphorobacter sp. HDW4A TaxID=2714924 RepID=UPI00140D8B9E|nr:acyltransferase [Diaphorobacter sp. HDW4A]QIL81736.1 acyltransferase [Diaphorobacter sp. HDW4A]